MRGYKHFILPTVLVGSAAVASVFATFIARRLRHARKGPQEVALADWEDEGGSLAAPLAATPADDDITAAIAHRCRP